jgi:predicted RNase H-like nuclease
MVIGGIDLAWGERNRDGVCFIRAGRSGARVLRFAYPRGDEELLQEIQNAMEDDGRTFLTIDAPIVCPNRSGTRPVDRLTHRLFHREHAACHPANSTKCPRPPRILRKLKRLGFRAGWEFNRHPRMVAEVYPHPAMVRLFRLERIVKYKKGRVVERRSEFSRLQHLMGQLLEREFGALELDAEARRLLSLPWTKALEDQLDALFCALLGLWHWTYRGRRSEIIGDVRRGFILLPEDLRRSRTATITP